MWCRALTEDEKEAGIRMSIVVGADELENRMERAVMYRIVEFEVEDGLEVDVEADLVGCIGWGVRGRRVLLSERWEGKSKLAGARCIEAVGFEYIEARVGRRRTDFEVDPDGMSARLRLLAEDEDEDIGVWALLQRFGQAAALSDVIFLELAVWLSLSVYWDTEVWRGAPLRRIHCSGKVLFLSCQFPPFDLWKQPSVDLSFPDSVTCYEAFHLLWCDSSGLPLTRLL